MRILEQCSRRVGAELEDAARALQAASAAYGDLEQITAARTGAPRLIPGPDA